ncbi:hypothetical protein M413DRAFT_28609 [Hebeloma cylindrosporum]|uniref:Succinate dehydrogenase assembly factor 4, mitochondrial n=1 Tax=Hebeloma cylindrosporum TaxID=76867 RepID=A0A0C3C912_HEBCY|nr:hypothetical protein M413DRAFT_28609 [Hebeloma cylindrosporum h7]
MFGIEVDGNNNHDMNRYYSPLRLFKRHVSINRPSPIPLPRDDQREFEDLQRKANQPTLHPDVPTPVAPEFEGDVNPTTGEKGGPKREPITRSTVDPGGDWSFKGRVSDF